MAARTCARSLAVVVLLVAVPAVLPAPANAVDVIPQRHAAEPLPGAALAAVVGDVDGDGARELVRLVPRPDDEVHLAIDVVSVDTNGLEVAEPADLRRSYGVEEVTEGQAVPDDDNKLAARVDEPARLVVQRVDGRERVLAMAIGRLQTPRPCCLTVWEVGVSAGRTTLALVSDPMRSADFIRVADLDADGTDELLVLEPPIATQPSALPAYVLRWSGDRFEEVEGSIGPVGDALPSLVPLGDSDGQPGEEVGALVRTNGTPSLVVLHRVAMAPDRSLRIDSAQLPFEGRLAALHGPDGGRIVLAAPPVGVELLSWAAGAGAVSVEAVSQRQGVPLAVLGAGDDARLALLRQGTLDILDADLVPVQGISAGPAAGTPRGTDLLPYVGPLPGGLLGDDEVLIFGGRAVLPRSMDRGSLILLRTLPVATLPGVTPVGTFGADRAWMALAAGELDAGRDGGSLREPAASPRGLAMTVATTETVLQEEAELGWLEPRAEDALVTGAPSRPTIRARQAFDLLFDGPPGTVVHSFVAGEAVDPPLTLDQSGEGVLRVEVPEPDAQGRTRFALRVMTVTPSGHGYGGVWPVIISTRPPALEVDPPPLGHLGLSVPVAGRTAPGASLLVDGSPVATGPDGEFRIEVPAGLLPRTVSIQATDELGNAAEAAISVVAPLDYRRLPWIAIVVALTLATAVMLYLRVPRPAAARLPSSTDEGTLEEIE